MLDSIACAKGEGKMQWSKVLLCAVLSFQTMTMAVEAVGEQVQASAPLELLKAGSYAELDADLNGIQTAYEQGKTDDVAVLAAFRAFYLSDPSLEPYFVEWRKRYPNSYAAHLALGIYYKYQGREARGGAWASETSSGRFASMDLAFSSALPELNKSLTLTKKPLVSYVHLIDIAAHEGDHDAADSALAAGNRADPHNFIVRMKYMEMLQPRWLGRDGDMQAFYQRCKVDGLDQAKLNFLQAEILENEAFDRDDNGIKDVVTRDDYAKAIALIEPHPTWLPSRQYGILLRRASGLSYQLGDYKSALKFASRGVQVLPDSADMFELRGTSELKLGQHKQALADLQKAADLGSVWSQVYVGAMYAKGETVARDYGKARVLFEAAAKQGSQEAVQNLKVLDSLETPDSKTQ